MLDQLDRLLPVILGCLVVALGFYLLWRLWGEREGRPGLILMVALMVGGGGTFAWWGLATFLAKS